MPVGDLIGLAQEALLLAVAVSVPVLGAAALVSFLVSVLQTATQITDSTLGHLPRLLVVAAGLVAVGPWMGSRIVEFAVRAFSGGS
jgi:flagellar biosynthetic protein FliQ